MFIQEYPGLVAPDLCERIIARFESEAEHRPSAVVVGGVLTVREGIRTGTVLPFVAYDAPAWQQLIAEVNPALISSMRMYCRGNPGLAALTDAEGLQCTRPLIERVDPGQGFTWHSDQTAAHRSRVVAGLLYLRAIADGGYTEFKIQNTRITPEAGKIVLFPPFWTHMHRGVSPTAHAKYVMSFFWVYAQPPPE